MSQDAWEPLLQKWLDGQLTPDEQEELEQHLLLHRAARDTLRQLVALDSDLRLWAGGDSIPSWLDPDARSRFQPPADVDARIEAGAPMHVDRLAARRDRPWPTLHPAWILGAAVLLVAAIAANFAVGWLRTWQSTTRTVATSGATAARDQRETMVEGGCAVLAQAANVRWNESTNAPKPGTTLAPRTLEMQSGTIQIEFFTGASLIVRGRASVKLISASEARLNYGTARLRVSPAARGFQLHTPQARIVDLGTDMGIQVGEDDDRTQVEVFAGEVELHHVGDSVEPLRQGYAMLLTPRGMQPVLGQGNSSFPTAESLRQELDRLRTRRLNDWKAQLASRVADERLVAFYAFEERGSSVLRDSAKRLDGLGDGGIVGAGWAAGRWPAKHALEFKRPTDRVRVSIPGEFAALSLTAWVRIDGLDRRYNALFLTDGNEPGKPHWQIYQDGTLMFSLQEKTTGDKDRTIYYSRPFFNNDQVGQWFHLAVTYDGSTGEVSQYVNGELFGLEVHSGHQAATPVVLGEAEIGNWGLPSPTHPFPVRNLNGRIDEFAIWSVALTEEEIKQQYEIGKPN